jgi:hypothetical protein
MNRDQQPQQQHGHHPGSVSEEVAKQLVEALGRLYAPPVTPPTPAPNSTALQYNAIKALLRTHSEKSVPPNAAGK